jgi:penicillin-binding protein 1B
VEDLAALNLAGFTQRTQSVLAAIRARVTRRRVVLALLVTFAAGTVGVTTEALVRGHIVPPSRRAPSALYTRPVAWGDDERRGAVAIGSLNASLNEVRDPVELDRVPKHLIDAVLAVEDQRFYDHHGLDVRRIGGALLANVKAVGVSEGGSTITQQLAKNLFLTADRTPIRKFREAALAIALEARHTKAQILEAYLNEIYFGQDGPAAIHGVGAAARFYFGKPVGRVSVAEAALLAGMIRSPNRLAPTRHPEDAANRRNLVLGLMVAQKRIKPGTAERARDARVSTRSYPMSSIDGRYFRDFVATSATNKLPDRGAAIYTTLDATLQRSAERAVVRGLGRLRLPGAQAALVAIDPRNGDILAMVGGRDYGASQFNRAIDAHRQPGSAFKPLVALAALEGGANGRPAFTLASILKDEPLSVQTPQGVWQPVNYDRGFRGDVTFREALEQSLNVPFARVGLAIGPARIASTAHRLGITSPLNEVPSLALGSSEVTLLEMVRAYGVLAAQGNLAVTRTIIGQRTPGGERLEAPESQVARVANPAATFLVTSALEGAVQHGTGRALDAGRFDGDIAGKTGTSNDWRDAWFIAYSPTIVVGVWVGYDDGRSLRMSGGAAAVPIVADFFTIADATEVESFDVPDGIEESYASGDSWYSCGEREFFLEGTAPQSAGCGFRAITDDAAEGLRELKRAFQRAILDRIRAEYDWYRNHR